MKPDLTDTAHNQTSGAVVWEGPVDLTYRHLPLKQTGSGMVSPSTAPADGYYVLEIYHTDCHSEVELCALPSDGVTFTTFGTVTILGPRPYPFLVPSAAAIAVVLSLAGFAFAAWFVVQGRSLPAARVRDVAKVAVIHPLVIGVVVVSIISGSIGGLNLYYGSQLTATQIRGPGSVGFATDSPCIPGRANPMLLWVDVYNAVDEKLNIQLGVIVNGTLYFTEITAGPRGRSGAPVFYMSYDCKDPVARAVFLSAAPAWW